MNLNTDILFIYEKNISLDIINNCDYLNIIYNNTSIDINSMELKKLNSYKKVVLLRPVINEGKYKCILKYCNDNNIEFTDTQNIKFSTIYRNIVDILIKRSIHYWRNNKCISNYLSDGQKYMLLKSFNIDLCITPEKDLLKNIESKNVINNFNNKFMSFILVLKNRNQRFEIFIKYLREVIDFNKYCELIIVEDVSNNKINLDLLGDLDYTYCLVNTGVGWSRTKLLNYGLSKTTLEISLFCDIDFVFDPLFLSKFIKNFSTFNFDKLALCIPVFETHNSFNVGKLVRKTNENYGHVLVVSTNKIKSLGGFDYRINNHGFEERELWIRCLMNGYEFMFINNIYNDIYVLHLSHDDTSRGIKRMNEEKKNIINILKNNTKIPFKYDLPTITIK